MRQSVETLISTNLNFLYHPTLDEPAPKVTLFCVYAIAFHVEEIKAMAKSVLMLRPPNHCANFQESRLDWIC